MKIIRTKSLTFQDTKSNKAYQVDLVETGTAQYEVHFRYGKIGSNLKAGIKTETPVSLDVATQVFEKLVAEKTKKGYVEDGSSAQNLQAEVREKGGNKAQNREEAILNRLVKAVSKNGNEKGEKWKLERVIWRAGEIGLKEATPHLINLWQTGDMMRNYCIIWALGRLKAGTALMELLPKFPKDAPTHLQSLFSTALLHFGSTTEKQELLTKIADALPNDLGNAWKLNAPEAYQTAFMAFMNTQDASYVNTQNQQTQQRGSFSAFEAAVKRVQMGLSNLVQKVQKTEKEAEPPKVILTKSDILEITYWFSTHSAEVRQGLISYLKIVPFKAPYFKGIRRIFKAAEMLLDAEIFGLIAYRLEKTNADFNMPTWGDTQWMYLNHRWVQVNLKEEAKKHDSHFGYSDHTQTYLKNRVWRTLRRIGTLGDAEQYVKMAVGVLLPYTDVDAGNAEKRTQVNGSWEQVNGSWQHHVTEIHRQYDVYASHRNFYHLLYKNSPRYLQKNHASKAYQVREGFLAGQTVSQREEAFPELWDKMPVGLMHLLMHSNSARVHEFAAKALKENTKFLKTLGETEMIHFLQSPYPETVDLGVEIAKVQFNPAAPDFDLTLLLLRSHSQNAHEVALNWIQSAQSHYFKTNDFMVELLFSPTPKVREWMGAELPKQSFDVSQTEAFLVKTIARLMGLQANVPQNHALVNDVQVALLKTFTTPLSKISLQVIADLMRHPLTEVQRFGATLLSQHQTKAEDLPANLLAQMIGSENADIRGLGIQTFAQLPDELLLERIDVFQGFCLSEYPDIRSNIRPTIQRLNQEYPSFGEVLTQALVPYLLKPEVTPQLHEDLIALLKTDLTSALPSIKPEMILRLLNSQQSLSTFFAEDLLHTQVQASALSLATCIELGNHELVGVRERIFTFFEAKIDEIKENPPEALRLLDSQWEDSRGFAFGFFERHFTQTDWTPTLLISVCDSTKPDVQHFGRALVKTYFHKKDGQEYLLKLSEHPSLTLQIFVAELLDQYARNDSKQLTELDYFFRSALTRVNVGRAAKEKIRLFLQQESLKSEAAANYVSNLYSWLVATTAVQERAHYIAALRNLALMYPELTQALAIIEKAEESELFDKALPFKS